MTVYILPQFPCALRYTEWLGPVLESGLRKLGIKVQPLMHYLPSITTTASGRFTELSDAITYELNALNNFQGELQKRNRVKPDDVLLVCDVSTPGLVNAFLTVRKPCRVVGICHGSSLNTLDIWSGNHAKMFQEMYTFRLYDHIVVASNYHREKLISNFPLIVVNNLGALPEDPDIGAIKPPRRRAGICSVARDTPQKRRTEVEQALTSFCHMKVDRPPEKGFNNRMEYYEWVAKHRFLLSTAREETYGIPIHEAIRLGVVPIAPHTLCYPEFLPAECMYETAGTEVDIAKSIAKVVRSGVAVPESKNKEQRENFFKNLAYLMVTK